MTSRHFVCLFCLFIFFKKGVKCEPFIPDAQTLLTEVAGTLAGIPEPIAACRAGCLEIRSRLLVRKRIQGEVESYKLYLFEC